MGTKDVLVGINRTGMATAQGRAEAMLRATEEFPLPKAVSPRSVAAVRERRASEAEPVGAMPLPETGRGDTDQGAAMLLLDKLGERLAFERTGARLYEVIRTKLEQEGEFAGGPTLEQIDRIIMQEFGHFRLVADLIETFGGDPTAITPSANLHATMTAGIVAVTVDPRTSLVQCLEAALLAELADKEGWLTLFQLMTSAEQTNTLEYVKRAVEVEDDHLQLVRLWLAKAQERDPIGRAPTLPEAAF
jgi:rubrerythrin